MSGLAGNAGSFFGFSLIMTSVVTLMAVVFLAVSRRERSSVRVAEVQSDARLMAEAGLARAQAGVLAEHADPAAIWLSGAAAAPRVTVNPETAVFEVN